MINLTVVAARIERWFEKFCFFEVFAAFAGYWFPLSLALSREGRGKVFLSVSSASSQVVESSGLFVAALDLCVPSPPAGEG